MGRSTISVKALGTTRSIPEAKRAKTRRMKSILARTGDNKIYNKKLITIVRAFEE